MRTRESNRATLTRAAIAAVLVVAVSLGLDEGTFGVNRPSLGSIAFVRSGDIWIASGSGSRLEKVVDDASSPAWSPDGRKLAFVRSGEIWSFDFRTTRQRKLTFSGKRGSDPAWLDRSTIAYCLTLDFELSPAQESAALFRAAAKIPTRETAFSAIWTVDAASPRPREHIGPLSRGLMGDYTSPAAHPRTGKLAFVLDGDVWIADSPGEPFRARRAAPCADIEMGSEAAKPVSGADTTSWTPDGVWVVFDVVDFASEDVGELWAVNSITGKTVQITRRVEFDLPPARGPSVSPAGGQIAYEEGNDVWLCGLDGSDSRRFLQNASQPAWSPRAAPLPRRPDGLLLPAGR